MVSVGFLGIMIEICLNCFLIEFWMCKYLEKLLIMKMILIFFVLGVWNILLICFIILLIVFLKKFFYILLFIVSLLEDNFILFFSILFLLIMFLKVLIL